MAEAVEVVDWVVFAVVKIEVVVAGVRVEVVRGIEEEIVIVKVLVVSWVVPVVAVARVDVAGIVNKWGSPIQTWGNCQ